MMIIWGLISTIVTCFYKIRTHTVCFQANENKAKEKKNNNNNNQGKGLEPHMESDNIKPTSLNTGSITWQQVLKYKEGTLKEELYR